MMRFKTISLVAVMALAACATTAPNDGDQYFDNITPDPSALAAENQRLQQAEAGTSTTNVTLPAGGNTTAVVATDPAASETISNTQDFRRIKEKESIESDAAKIAALKQTYEVVPPTSVEVPTRSSNVNLASYAISQKNAVGTRVYRRNRVAGNNCGRYRNDPDGAQRAFLEAGGPAKDKLRLDPDGDGFACNWNPDTYRRLLQNTG